MTTMRPKPWANDAEHLDEAIRVLVARARRVGAEIKLMKAEAEQDRSPSPKVRQAAVTARSREEAITEAYRKRLEIHRSEGDVTLGLDRLALDHDLTEQHRIILLLGFVAATNDALAEDVLSDLDTFSVICPESIARLLEAGTTADRLRLLRCFEPDAPLMKGGLLAFSQPPSSPEDLLNYRLTITRKAFDVLVGRGP